GSARAAGHRRQGAHRRAPVLAHVERVSDHPRVASWPDAGANLQPGAELMMSLLLLMLWDGPKLWTESASSMPLGGGGIIATGGAGDYYITCAECHIKSDPSRYGLIDFQMTFVPALSSVGGAEAYKPGQTYQVTARMMG